jgi:hypothetical protein
MKYYLTFIFSFITFLSIIGQTNLISDPNFDNADLQRVYSQTFPNVWYNVWTSHIHETQVSSSILVESDIAKGNVGAMINGAQNIANAYAWRAFIAQRIQTTAEQSLYKLSFWGKSSNGASTARIFSITGQRNQNNQYKYFIFDTDKPTEPTGKYFAFCKNIPLSTDWQYFEYMLDFSKTTDQLASIAYNSLVESTNEDLTNFTICLQNNAANSTMQIDEVSLVKNIDTSIYGVENDGCRVLVEGNEINIANHVGYVSVFDLTGKQVNSTLLEGNGKLIVNQSGVFLVRIGDYIRKIIIQ